MERAAQDLGDIAQDLRANTNVVLQRWEALADERPWVDLPDPERKDRLADLVRGLADAALTIPVETARVREVVRCGVDHGRDRRKQGLDTDDLFREYYSLRTAIWDVVRERHQSHEDVATAMLRIDAAITTATGASLVGFHEAELEGAGAIGAHLERLVRDSVLLA